MERTCAGGVDRNLDAVRLLDVGELAALLGISERTAWRLNALAEAGQERFPRAITIGPRLRRWRLRDVQAYLDAGGNN